MPIYEYYCPQCEQEFELTRPFSESGESGRCPTCGTAAAKVPSVFASNEGYSVKVPHGPVFRRKEPGAEASGPKS